MASAAKEPHGMGGWLLFFILTLTLLGPPWKGWRIHSRLQETAALYPEYAASEEWADLVCITWTSFGIAVLIGMAAGMIMLKWRNARSVKIALASLWVMGPLISAVGHLIALQRANLAWSPEDWPMLIVPTISAALWTAYLLKSRRVRNTYNFLGLFEKSVGDSKAEAQP